MGLCARSRACAVGTFLKCYLSRLPALGEAAQSLAPPSLGDTLDLVRDLYSPPSSIVSHALLVIAQSYSSHPPTVVQQVLPRRTHPMVRIPDDSGFILWGTWVCNEFTERLSPLSDNVPVVACPAHLLGAAAEARAKARAASKAAYEARLQQEQQAGGKARATAEPGAAAAAAAGDNGAVAEEDTAMQSVEATTTTTTVAATPASTGDSERPTKRSRA